MCLSSTINFVLRALGITFLTGVLIMLLALPAIAELYRYVDDKGVVHITNNKEDIPGQYLDRVEVSEGRGTDGYRPPENIGKEEGEGRPLWGMKEDPWFKKAYDGLMDFLTDSGYGVAVGVLGGLVVLILISRLFTGKS